ncbi:MAG: hypothetical protein K8F91_20470, partial [Candidatus Obscuribacterales bacterium]|nr:hypothetical protein [Candidatus Obscuribacterales bacterium]
IYSLGCVLYHCLTGAPPFIGNTKMETMLMHLNNAPLPVNEKMEETVIEPAFDRIVMKLLEKKQADRFQSMSEVKASLQGSAENIFLPAETQADQAQSSEAGKKAPAKKSAPPTRMILLASASVATILFSTGLLTAYFIQNNQSNRVADTIGSVRQKVDDLSDKIYEPDITFQGTIGRDVSRKHPIIDSDGLSITDEALTHLSEAQGIGLLTLILKDSPVTGKGMSYLADLKIPIASLDLTNTRVDNQAMEQIARIRPLKSLNLTGLKLNDSGMQALAASPSLIDLDLTGNDIGDDGLARLALLTTLQKLNLKANGVSDAGIVYLKKLKNLTDLDLSGCAITDQAVKEIAGLKTIEKLSLDGTKISRASLKNLARMPNLIILDLSDTNLDDLKSADLLQFKRLQKLRLHNIDLKSEEVLSFQRLNPSCSIRFE